MTADLPAKAGAGLPRMLQLAATDPASLERVRRALGALERKGLLDGGYLRLAGEKLDAAARALAEDAAAAAAMAAAVADARRVSVLVGFDCWELISALCFAVGLP